MKLTEHTKRLPKIPVSLRVALIITSDIRTEKTDKTGDIIVSLLEKEGHKCVRRKIVPNKSALIYAEVRSALKSADMVITSGGTGISRKDMTIEAVSCFVARKLDGFGEIFRLLSFGEIGSSAMMSRAMLGITKDNKIICAIPGSPNGVSVAMNELLLPELPHIYWELNR